MRSLPVEALSIASHLRVSLSARLSGWASTGLCGQGRAGFPRRSHSISSFVLSEAKGTSGALAVADIWAVGDDSSGEAPRTRLRQQWTKQCRRLSMRAIANVRKASEAAHVQ